jgi:hypothetical protein
MEVIFMIYVVITSINSPNEAIRKLSQIKGFKTIVIGDYKSPKHYFHDNIHYYSLNDQGKLGFELFAKLPFNHYSRKMLGYLIAISENASAIIDIDDDNIPNDDWNFPECDGIFDLVSSEQSGFLNVYKYFTDYMIWPRGLPLELINSKNDHFKINSDVNCRVGIWQGLANGDPDVDAIYRLTNHSADFEFIPREPIVLDIGIFTPFNSQNTLTYKQLFPLLYLPTTVSFRYTDILRSYVAQPIMWLYGFKVGVVSANVFQERNKHNLLEDFKSEIPMYLNPNVINIISSAINKKNDIYENLFSVYSSLAEKEIVGLEEINSVRSWINDCVVLLNE